MIIAFFILEKAFTLKIEGTGVFIHWFLEVEVVKLLLLLVSIKKFKKEIFIVFV